jgi:signal transduction histidine kinase
MIKLPEKRVLGRPVQELLPISDQMIQSGRFETSLGTRAETRHFQAETSALDDGRGLEVGRLLLLHEVTEQKKAEARLIEQQRVLATLRERERLARELHDELAQGLALINLQAQLVRDLLDAGQMEQAKEQLQVLAQAARDAHVDVRGEIGELAHGIRSEEGLTGALRRITENFQQVNGIQTELAFLGEGPLSPIAPTVEVQLMRIVQEALANIRKHARAKHVKVTLRKEPGCLELTIQDDGIGFDHSSLSASPRTFGLGIMSERAEEISGRVEVLSSVGMGTTVRVVVPLDGS